MRTRQINYDANVVRAYAVQHVRLTLAQWNFRAVEEVEVHGNVPGLGVIRAAVGVLYEKLDVIDSVPRLTLKKGGVDLFVFDEEENGRDWLEEFVVRAEIISVPQKAAKTERK